MLYPSLLFSLLSGYLKFMREMRGEEYQGDDIPEYDDMEELYMDEGEARRSAVPTLYEQKLLDPALTEDVPERLQKRVNRRKKAGLEKKRYKALRDKFLFTSDEEKEERWDHYLTWREEGKRIPLKEADHSAAFKEYLKKMDVASLSGERSLSDEEMKKEVHDFRAKVTEEEDKELEVESRWILSQLHHEKEPRASFNVLQQIKLIKNVLRMLRFEYLEIPYIELYRTDEWMGLQHPLNIHMSPVLLAAQKQDKSVVKAEVIDIPAYATSFSHAQ